MTPMAVVFSKQGRYDEAVTSLKTASECDGSSAQPHSSLAVIYNALGDRHNAARHYSIAVQLAPHLSNVLLNYAMFLHRHGPSTSFAVFDWPYDKLLVRNSDIRVRKMTFNKYLLDFYTTVIFIDCTLSVSRRIVFLFSFYWTFSHFIRYK